MGNKIFGIVIAGIIGVTAFGHVQAEIEQNVNQVSACIDQLNAQYSTC